MNRRLLLTVLISLPIVVNAQSWVQKASLPDSTAARNHPITFAIDGFAYLTTGYTITGNVNQKDFYQYEPVSDVWTKLEDFPGLARGFSYGIATGGKGYLGFGVSDTGWLNDLWMYDPVINIWEQKASCPGLGRSHPAFVEANGKIYVGLGGSIMGNLDDFWEYTIATNTWKPISNFPSHKRHHPFYFSIGDYVYVGFGHGNVDVDGFNIYRDFYRYDPSNDTWLKLNDFPGEARVAGTQFSYNGKGYVLHGEGEEHGLFEEGEFWEYDPATDTWVELEPAPGGSRWAPGTFVLGNTVYTTCGSGGDDYADKKDLWAYSFTVSSTTDSKNEPFDLPQIHPNPASEKIYLEQVDLLGEHSFQVLSSSGTLQMEGKNAEKGINISHLPTGMYWLILTTDSDPIKLKFVKN